MGDFLEPGVTAPAFSLADENGEKVRLSQFKGKPVVLYFYPKDDTPGCTKEACAFRDVHSKLEEAARFVMGVSPDSSSPMPSSIANTISILRSCRIQTTRSQMLMEHGEKRICTARRRWAFNAVRI